jgi:lipase
VSGPAAAAPVPGALASVRLGRPGGRAALMAHCFLGHAGAWKGLAARLDPPVDAVAFDLPGHGRSPMPEAPGDFLSEVAEMVRALPGALPRGTPSGVLGIGHSFGGALLLRLAIEEPGRFAGLVLIEPVFFAAARGTPAHARWQADEGPVHAALSEGRPEEAARVFLAQNGDGTPWEAIPEAERARLVRLIPLITATGAALIDDAGAMLAPGRLEGLDLPVLLVSATGSAPIFEAICARLAARLPRARHVRIPDAGHMLPITHAAAVAGAIDDWRRDHGL